MKYQFMDQLCCYLDMWPWSKLFLCVLVTWSCPIVCDPMDCSPVGFSIHGILQARILEWVAIPFSRVSSNPGIKSGSPALQAESLSITRLM